MEHEASSTIPSLTLKARPERKFIRTGGSTHAIDLTIQVGSAPVQDKAARLPLNLALVLDRSGSMHGEKIRIAKQAVHAVLDRLTAQDAIALVVFDDYIDIIQPMTAVTSALKSQAREALSAIEARGSTALHEGWLSGCNALVSNTPGAGKNRFSRCFLLTDGIANVGVTDPEQIASEAAGVREHTGVATSTFGIGNDYNELLLGPMAVGGGGQFHHLRTPEEIINTFVNELGDLSRVAARQVRIEIAVEQGTKIDLVSAYWMNASNDIITLGDLQYDEEQHVIIEAHFPEQIKEEICTIRTRLGWLANDRAYTTDWQTLRFAYASDTICDDEARDPEVIRYVGPEQANRARREAIALNNKRDIAGARANLYRARQKLQNYGSTDEDLNTAIDDLLSIEQELQQAPLSPAAAKEHYYQQQRMSQNRPDSRYSAPPPQNRPRENVWRMKKRKLQEQQNNHKDKQS